MERTKKWYFTKSYENYIKEQVIIKQTENSVFYINAYGKEVMERKSSNYIHWHKTKEEALNFLLNKIDTEINNHDTQIDALFERKKNIINKYHNE